MTNDRIGIIDIGSNSVRLVIYERTDTGAYRVIDESKESARLSARIAPDGSIPEEDTRKLARMLNEFRLLCQVHAVGHIRAVATAAIRNAANGPQVAAELQRLSGMPIEILSGKEEARLGFLGMINALDVSDGFLIDIGGGSTEVSLFRDRKLVRSVSFPFGAVNTAKRFARSELSRDDINQIRDMVAEAAASEPWLSAQPPLPLVGLGGTIRSLCKIDQRRTKYALQQTHQYELKSESLGHLAEWLPSLNAKERSKVDGLSDSRSDIIVPGLTILHTLYSLIGATRCIVSGAGLRDGVFYETAFPGAPARSHVLDDSARNLLALHPIVSRAHAEQVALLSMRLFDDLALHRLYGGRVRQLLHASSLLYRIGVAVDYYDFYKHTFYLLVHSRIDGLTHREAVLCALIASYKSKGRLRSMMSPFRELLDERDLELVGRLGTLLQLAISLDRSETQPVTELRATLDQQDLSIHWTCRHEPTIELGEIARISGEFRKIWGVRIKTNLALVSR